MTLTGKGYYIHVVKNCESGDPDKIATLAREANLSHVLVKIADGAFPYNVDLNNGYDYAKPAIKKLQAQNIQVWGWQYVYGDYPDQEAEIAVKRALEWAWTALWSTRKSNMRTNQRRPQRRSI